MYHHVKKMMYTVKVGTPDVRFESMLLEQFGGAAIQYTEDPDTIDALQFLMTREITHMKAFSAALDSMEKTAILDWPSRADAWSCGRVLQCIHG
jgi:Mn-containing catalase